MSTVLLTGATGFVGSVVLAQLLEGTDHEVACVVRGDAEPRLDHVLTEVLGLPAELHGRVRAVPGDVTEPGVVTDRDDALRGVDAVVHCAAAIDFDLALDEARESNVEGTRNVVALAQGRRLVHVSTAYVAGRRTGLVREDEGRVGQEFRNTYEQTKLEAEDLVPDDAAIVRPSIVVGEAATGWTSAFNVLYAPLKAYARGHLEEVPGSPDGLLDVVPVDSVARAAVVLATERTDVSGAVHVASGERSVAIGELARMVADVLGRAPLRFGGGDLGVYAPYLDVRAEFDDARAREVLGAPVPDLRSYVEPLVRFAEAAQWGRAPIRRSDAAAATATA